jgi:hypothetical protein
MKNRLKIIETPDYYLAVSDEAGNHGAYRLEYISHRPHCYTRIYCKKLKKPTIALWDKGVWKGEAGFTYQIIAYQPKGNAPELDLPLLPEIVVEDDVNKLALQDFKDNDDGFVSYKDRTEGFIEGYKAATKVYREDDLRKAFEAGMRFVGEDKGSYEELIQSLKQPKPKWFVAEIETRFKDFNETSKHQEWKLKTTTINGKIYLVGTYEY